MTLIVSVSTSRWGILAGDGRQIQRATGSVSANSARKVRRLTDRLVVSTCGSVIHGNALKEALSETVGEMNPLPEASFAEFLAYLQELAIFAWGLDQHPDGERLGITVLGYDAIVKKIRALSTDQTSGFNWEEDLRSLQIHWQGPQEDVGSIVQRWFERFEKKL